MDRVVFCEGKEWGIHAWMEGRMKGEGGIHA